MILSILDFDCTHQVAASSHNLNQVDNCPYTFELKATGIWHRAIDKELKLHFRLGIGLHLAFFLKEDLFWLI